METLPGRSGRPPLPHPLDRLLRDRTKPGAPVSRNRSAVPGSPSIEAARTASGARYRKVRI